MAVEQDILVATKKATDVDVNVFRYVTSYILTYSPSLDIGSIFNSAFVYSYLGHSIEEFRRHQISRFLLQSRFNTDQLIVTKVERLFPLRTESDPGEIQRNPRVALPRKRNCAPGSRNEFEQCPGLRGCPRYDACLRVIKWLFSY